MSTKHVLSLYTLPDGSDHHAAAIDTPDWESSTLYEKGQAKNAYLQMTHALAWAILGDFSASYAVAYWKLDAEGYSACEAIRTITSEAAQPAPLADVELADLKNKLVRAHGLPWGVHHGHDTVIFFDENRNGIRPNPYHPICRMEEMEDGLTEHNAEYLAAACNYLPGLLARLDASEARPTRKTYQALKDSQIPAAKYLQPGDEVDEEMVNHFGGVVSPQYCTHHFTQVGEADYEQAGRLHYMTFGLFGERYLYLGILPPFKQPKH